MGDLLAKNEDINRVYGERCVCIGGGAKAGQGSALTKEPLQCLNGLPCHEHGGHLIYQCK